MGRPAKSQALHDLHGTKQRSNLGESYVEGALPRPPTSFNKELKKKFRSLVKQLADRRAVTAGDADLIAIYCGTWARLQVALKNIEDEGLIVSYDRLDSNGVAHAVERPNVSLKIAENAERACLSYLARLGLTPKDREGVKPTAPTAPKNQPTELERLDAEIAALEVQEPAPDDEQQAEEDLLNNIDIEDEALTESQKLMKEADAALEEDKEI